MRIINVFIISILLVGIWSSPLVQAQSFEDLVTVEYEQCTGDVTVEFIVWDDAAALGACVGDNQLDRLRITAVRPNNTEQLLGIYVWDNQNNDPTNYPAFICGSNLDFPTGGGANCRGYYFCSNAIGSFSSRFDGSNGYEYVKLRFRNMDDVFFGQTTKIKLVGSWDGRAVNQTFDDATQSDAPSVTNVQATTDTHCDKVRVTWDNPSLDCSASQYTAEIQRKLATDSNWPSPTIGTVNLAATNNTIFDDFTATKGLEYDYRVRVAFRPNFARTDVSNPTSTNSSGRRRGALPPPENIRASSGSCEDHIQVRWDWNQGTTNLGGFRIQRRPTSISTWTTIADNIDSGDREYQDLLNDASPVVPNVDYQYRVFSLNDCPVPDVSAVPSLTSNAIGNSPGAPSGPSAIMVVAETGVGANAINISWTHTAGATDEGFLLIRQGGGNTARIEIDDVNQRTYMDNDVQGCVNYTYTIKTKSECFPDGIGTQSASAILTPDLTQAFATDGTGLLASKGFFTDKVELTWTNSNQGQTSDHLIGRRLLGTSGAFANIASVGNTVELYNDETAEAGIFYEYEIVALDNCQGTPSNRVQAVGFRAQSGIVSGQVAYTGGFAVEGVKIIAETQSGQDPKSVLLNGSGAKLTIDTSASLRTMTDAAILETWVKLGSTAYSRSFDIFKKDGAVSPFSLGYNLSTNRYEATVRDQASRRIDLNFPISEIQIEQWIHVAMELENDTLYLYVDGNVVAQGHNNSFQELRNTAGKVQLGCNLAGHMKEVRFWRIAKDSTTFARDFSRFMSGQEEDLVMYLPLTEGVGDFGYDRSKDGQQFNRNHAEIVNGTWDQTPLPTTSQLGLASYTDDRGNYTILLPYRNAGELYRLIPFFPNHEFEPRNRDLFIGDGSPVINGVDFEDVSSFLTKGTLFFDGTNCPVSGANLKVDGQFVTDANGRLVETNNLGEWEIRVPIGDHFVEIEKRNHIMSEGRFPPTGTINFQEPRSNIRFMDTTLIKVVGRVVGGTREGDKDPALGKSKNNIGVAELMFEELGGCLTDTVTTDSMTGEYIAYLPPLGYQPDVRVPSNSSLIPEFNKLEDPINLTMAFDTLSVSDTIPTPGPLDSVVTVEYNERLDYVIRFDPQIEVVDEFGLPFIGDTLYTYTHPATGETVTRNLRTDPFNWPVFTQGDVNKMYWVGILPYEQYVNLDKGAPGVIDSVPFNDGEIIINNELADAPYMEVKIKDVNPTDTLKTIWHQFLPGEPNTFPNTSIPQYSYTKKFEIGLRKNNGDIIPWNPVPLPQVPMGGDQIFRGYLLGGIVKEPGVITLGPEVPEYVLRDPPGSQSTAQRKVNTSKTDVRSWSWALKGATNVSDDLYVGADFTIGFGTATATEVFNNISVGYTTAVSGGRSGALKTTTTNSEAINTSGSGAFVGARGDVYLGYSQNLEIGTAEVLSIVPDTLSNIEFNDNTGIQNLNGFAFATRYTLSIEPDGYETRFVYSERFLESNVIPNLKRVRDLKLQTDPKYTNVTGNPGDPLYGADNDDPAWGAMASVCPNPDVTDCPAVLTGPSYTYNAVNNNDQDSVRWFNQQIRLWEDAIALNEWEKANIDDPDVIDSL
ncbi:MAG: LamG-like jellyroll fold domain-containing protein, partial [Bacteroidota bacterium]